MNVTQLALTWIGWPNSEKLALTFVQIWSRPKWAQVIASQRKCTQVLAKRSRKWTQVFNLRLLATPFDQGFRLLSTCRPRSGAGGDRVTFFPRRVTWKSAGSLWSIWRVPNTSILVFSSFYEKAVVTAPACDFFKVFVDLLNHITSLSNWERKV